MTIQPAQKNLPVIKETTIRTNPSPAPRVKLIVTRTSTSPRVITPNIAQHSKKISSYPPTVHVIPEEDNNLQATMTIRNDNRNAPHIIPEDDVWSKTQLYIHNYNTCISSKYEFAAAVLQNQFL